MEQGENILKQAFSEETKHLFKGFLEILEDIKTDYDSAMIRLRDNYPEMSKIINVSDILDERKMKQLRKRVLDLGNGAIRNNDRHVERIYLKFKQR